MSNQLRLSISGILFLLFIGALFLMAALNYAGVCIPKGRFLSDQEKIKIAVIAVNENNRVNYQEASHEWVVYDRIKYPTMQSFFEENPDCCTAGKGVTGDVVPPTFFERISGNFAGLVRVKYKAHFLDKNGRSGEHLMNSVFSINNCGTDLN